MARHPDLRPDRILLCGDPHGIFTPLIEAALARRPEAVILLGDLDPSRPLEEELAPLLEAGIGVFFIHGNHESDTVEWHDRVFASNLAGNNLHARVADIAGVRVAGLGGVFRGQVWNPNTAELALYATRAEHAQKLAPEVWAQAKADRRKWRGGVPLRHRTSIYPEDARRLMNRRADLLVCHEAPSCMISARGRRLGFAEIDRIAAALGVRTIVHGHHHHHYEAEVGNGIRVIGVGRSGVVDLDGNILVHGKPRMPPDETVQA